MQPTSRRSAEILDEQSVLDGRALAGGDLGERGAPPAEAHDPAGIGRKARRVQFHQREEVAGIPAAAEDQFVGPHRAGLEPPATDVAAVGPRIGIAQQPLGECLVGERDAGGFHPLVPERTRVGLNRCHRFVGEQPGQRHQPSTRTVELKRGLTGCRGLIAQVVEHFVGDEAVASVTCFGGDSLQHGDAHVGRAVPARVWPVGNHRAVRGSLHHEPVPQPLHSRVGVDPVVAGPLVGGPGEDDVGHHHVMAVVLAHVLDPPEIVEDEF